MREIILSKVSTNVTIIVKDGKLSSMSLDTKIKYFPTQGEYSDRRVPLDNVLSIDVNKKLSTAASYTAPEKADGTIVGLCASKYFIFIYRFAKLKNNN